MASHEMHAACAVPLWALIPATSSSTGHSGGLAIPYTQSPLPASASKHHTQRGQHAQRDPQQRLPMVLRYGLALPLACSAERAARLLQQALRGGGLQVQGGGAFPELELAQVLHASASMDLLAPLRCPAELFGSIAGVCDCVCV